MRDERELWQYGRDPAHFDAPEVISPRWRIYVPTDTDARRIVAAVNACIGIPTEALESGAVKTLIEALDLLYRWENGDETVKALDPVMDLARAALAKVRP